MNTKKINIAEKIVLESITLKRTHKDFAEERLKTLHDNLDHIMTFLTFADSTYSLEDDLKYIAGCSEKWEKEQSFEFCIFENLTNKYLGCISLIVKSHTRSEYEFGYWLIKSAQKKGYISQAVRYLTNFLEQEVNANRIIIRCNDRNLKSAGVAIRNGFLFEFRALCGDREDDFYSFVKLSNKNKQQELLTIQEDLKRIHKVKI